MGELPAGRFRASEERGRTGGGLAHTLQANDFLILCCRLAREISAVSVAEVRTERELRRVPMMVEASGRRVALVPDGWVDLHLGASERMSLAVELDRGTMERRAFQAKVRAYCEASRGEYKRVFASPSLSVLFVVTTGSKRLVELLAWTEGALRQTRNEHLADLFRFASMDPGEADAKSTFFDEVWRRAFDTRPLALIPTPPESSRQQRTEGGDEL